ncbi:MAG: DUF1080 domain-containing protein [Planctomycetales bacterium]|nr:DUF1080 domain-containing protein [Planctomycetales bacterium]
MKYVQRLAKVLMLLALVAAPAIAEDELFVHSFERLQLTDKFYCEGASFADFNRDGKMDVVSGPYWYAGPDFVERQEYYPAEAYDINGYSLNFLTYAYDVDQDGWPDVLVIGFPGKETYWYQNPQGKTGHWPRHLVHEVVDNESPTVADLTGDGNPELVFHTGGQLGYAGPNLADPTKPWVFHAISPIRDYQRFTHGLGVGDVNGDGRLDLLEKGAWWEQPAGDTEDGFWIRHEFPFTEAGGAQMFAYDFDGDGDNDVVTSKAAHAYGLSWFENVRDGDAIRFVEHKIMGETPEENDYGVVFSQLHAQVLADMDRDGVMDIVTGKRYWAHNGHDPGANDPAVSYWFQTVREDGKVRFVPHRIDVNSGVGTQVSAGDLNGDQWPDVIVGNKKGTFALIHHAKSADRETWEKAQPQPTNPDIKKNAVQTSATPPGATGTKHAGLSPEAAAAAMTVPAGFSVQAFAGEPDVAQPIAMAIDDRGRIWVAEAYEYPRRAPEGEGRDRILIFEDTNLDGKFDKRTVFIEGLNLVSGLEVGFGGVWVGAAPYFMFIPDSDGDDAPDGEPQVLLDGWHYEDTHETLNAFIWGPDGWLYGCHGVFTYSIVGKPGAPENERTPMNAGVWRYHPTRHEFEVFAHGSSNPWGVDFNDQGQMFITACVIPHLYHVIQGARYQRQGGQHFNRYTYDDIKTIADHAHYAGDIRDHAWWGRDEPASNASTDAAGGGHAHAGAMIYLGGSWPEQYRNQIFMNNIHGARLNQDILTPHGSGYVGQHGSDFLFAHDQASQIINLRYGPDGQVYFIDWYDMQQCHRHEPSAHDRSNGRIFRLAHDSQAPVQVDLQKLSDKELVELQLHKNDWFVRHARRILQERAVKNEIQPAAVSRLVEIATSHAEDTRRLRALWALHVTGNLPIELVVQLASDKSPYLRGWVVQAVLEQSGGEPSPELVLGLAALAHGDPSPIVRLYLASACQRVPLEARWEILDALLSHAEDAGDHNLPLMYWYAFEPLVETDMEFALELAGRGKIPVVFEHTVRRIAEIGSQEAVALLVGALGESDDDTQRATILRAMSVALQGTRSFEMPEQWSAVYTKLADSGADEVRTPARRLAVKFGDARALAETRAILSDSQAELEARVSALKSLLAIKESELAPLLQSLVADRALRREALRGLAAYDDPQTASVVLAAYSSFSADERRDALSTLASRPQYASELLSAVQAKRIASSDLPADLIRQLGNLRDEAIKQQVAEIWGVVRETAEDKKKQMAMYQQMILGDGPEPDIHLGRAIFAGTCQQCHKLFGVGHSIGPELTGSNRANLEYLLANVVDPSAVMAKEYQPTVVVTDDGRTITGLVQAEDDLSITFATATETIVLPRDEIEESFLGQNSMMPDNQWQQMKPHEIRSLVAYLASPQQVPLLATADNAASFFNGTDLAGWSGDMKHWRVEEGEIIGTSEGIDKNTFLVSDLAVEDFELSFQVKLTPNGGNSGVQFRSEALPNGDVKGYQADIGAGWWGKLYEEHGRAILWDKSATEHVRENQWNEYRIVAEGSRIQTYLNGQLCVDLDDPAGARRGIIALQIHSGPAMEVRFKDLQLTIAGGEGE